MKVNLLIIGAQKCGTSTLFQILDSHPMMVGSRPKEPMFFCRTDNWQRDLANYEACFEHDNGRIYFEASTTYTFLPYRRLHIWEDIYDYNPDIKLIYLVRNPVERIVSSYMHAYARGYTRESIDRAIAREGFFINITRYATQIRPFINRFGGSRVLIIDFDDLIHRRSTVVRRVGDFVGVDSDQFGRFERVHANASVGTQRPHHMMTDPHPVLKPVRRFWPTMWSRLIDKTTTSFAEKPKLGLAQQRMIIDMLDLEISETERLIGKDLSGWRSVEG